MSLVSFEDSPGVNVLGSPVSTGAGIMSSSTSRDLATSAAVSPAFLFFDS